MARRRRKPVEQDGYRLEARPSSWCRHIWDIAPYFQGSVTSFDITVTRVAKEPAQEQPMRWWLVFANSERTTDKTMIPALKKDERYVIRGIGEDRLLGYTGDTVLTICAQGLNVPHTEPYHTLYSFYVTPRAWVSLTAFAGLIAGLVAAALGAHL
jgi:hypothetical protein